MSDKVWRQAWQQTMHKHGLGLLAFQDAVMLGRIKLKFIKRGNENRSQLKLPT